MKLETMNSVVALAMAFGFASAFAAPPVKIAIESVPEGVDVTVAEQNCTTPCQLEVPRGMQTFKGEKTDFKPATVKENVVRAGQVVKLNLEYAIPYYKAGEGLTDSRNKKKYKTRILLSKDGNSQQEWMAENLNIVTKTSKCPEGNKQNCAKQGRLYSWADAMYLDPEMNTRDDAEQFVDSYRQGVCPDGWRLPTWQDMELALTLYWSHEWRPNGQKDLGFDGDEFWSGIAENHMIFSSNQFNREFKLNQIGAPDVSGRKVGGWNGASNMNFVRCVKAEAVVEGQKLNVMNQVLVRDGTTLAPAERKPYDAMGMAEGTRDGMGYERMFGGFVIVKQPLPKFTDRSGKVYPVTKIGKQVWTAQNLDYVMDGSFCYNDNPGNCAKYGRLYTWNAAINACPARWHLPTIEEWIELEKAIGEEAGTKLKSKAWDGMDEFGFHALPAGNRNNNDDAFYRIGTNAGFWTASEAHWADYDGLEAFRFDLSSNNAVLHSGSRDKNNAYSVRCVKD